MNLKSILEALALGFSTGTYCTMYCAPVLIPFLCGTEKSGCRRNALLTGTFLGSRLIMYFILGAVFSALGLLATAFFDPVLARRLSVYAYILCGAALLLNSAGAHSAHTCCSRVPLRRIGNDWVTAALAGLAAGLHLCPPLWTALVRSVFGGNGAGGFFYFIFFYIGTLPFFLPLLGIPFITKRIAVVRRIARITQMLTGIYFVVFAGLIPLFFN